ncbi:3-methyl-2-oxobutanoate hydroxymethyltransferase [Alicyclobacillus sendaiensis]|uniref:3-methyl-2-oxobutanoate hydroxymethyltransferase n=1 Tax=Alicyclobacillus sendaiensis TaxID=192387 RepID=UPI0007841FE5|nr:3-methyl-2-oxobutanoate hydroxymethyltransferase [Alicyclobacillus sendaiensis]
MARTVTVRTLANMKRAGEKIAMLTAYDYPTAKLLSEAGVHVLLVGDSLGMVVQGQPTTVPVTLDQMVYHASLVSRGAGGAMVVADLPFLTYQVSAEEAMRSAGRLMQEGGVHGVKLEGGREIAQTVRRLVDAGIPVMGHIGLTPQSVHAFGGFAVQGKTADRALEMMEDAVALEEAGAFSIVLEAVPAEVAAEITRRLTIPTIGIGAGPHCDGQVLVFHDFIGYTSGYIPKHNKRYADLASVIRDAARQYIEEVSQGVFPGEEQTVHLQDAELRLFQSMVASYGGGPRE